MPANRFVTDTAGGGEWGTPMRKEPEKEDAQDGLSSPIPATEVHGAVVGSQERMDPEVSDRHHKAVGR